MQEAGTLRAALLGVGIALSITGTAAAADPANGEKVFKRCGACHVANKEQNKVGPHLVGIIGRKAGAVEGYKYSAAMQTKSEEGLVWNDENLSKYLENPKGLVPKGKMAFPGLKKESDRADVIAYLEQATTGS